MSNIASVLKSEIARIARKEVRAEIDGLRKAVTAHRSAIAELKRKNQQLEHLLRQRSQPAIGAKPAPGGHEPAADSARMLRFSAQGLAAQRRRLGLSAQQCGLLVGVSDQSIYKWEEGTVRPRTKHLLAIAALRAMGRKEAAARLAALAGA